MASAGATAVLKTAAAAVFVVVVLLSMDPPPAMADHLSYCHAGCFDACNLFANATCRGVSTAKSCLTSEQCFWKVINLCGPTCYNGCTTPSPPGGASCCTNGYMSDGTPCLPH